MKRMSFYARSEVVDSISLVQIALKSGQEKAHGDGVLAVAKMMKSCAISAASYDGLNHCGLTPVMQTMHKEEMRIKQRKSLFRIAALPAAKLELTKL